jgi:hypothetical protein
MGTYTQVQAARVPSTHASDQRTAMIHAWPCTPRTPVHPWTAGHRPPGHPMHGRTGHATPDARPGPCDPPSPSLPHGCEALACPGRPLTGRWWASRPRGAPGGHPGTGGQQEAACWPWASGDQASTWQGPGWWTAVPPAGGQAPARLVHQSRRKCWQGKGWGWCTEKFREGGLDGWTTGL